QTRPDPDQGQDAGADDSADAQRHKVRPAQGFLEPRSRMRGQHRVDRATTVPERHNLLLPLAASFRRLIQGATLARDAITIKDAFDACASPRVRVIGAPFAEAISAAAKDRRHTKGADDGTGD